MITLKDLERLKAEGKIRGFTDPKEGQTGTKRNKYGARKVVMDGHTFDSQKEARRYMELRMKLLAGEIYGLTVHVPFDLVVEGELVARYISDFVYYENGERVVEDVKSKITRRLSTYRLKKKLMKSIHNIEIKEV